MKSREMLGMMLAMSMMSEVSMLNSELNPIKHQPSREPKKIIPKGCKEYFFVNSGTFFNNMPRKNSGYVVIYQCIASSDKKAIEKFNKFKTKL